MKLTMDPQDFDPQVCLREFIAVNDKFKIMKNDMVSLYSSFFCFCRKVVGKCVFCSLCSFIFAAFVQLNFPIVKSNHWIICSVNLLYKQLHVFDSINNSKNQSTLQYAADNLVIFCFRVFMFFLFQQHLFGLIILFKNVVYKLRDVACCCKMHKH